MAGGAVKFTTDMRGRGVVAATRSTARTAARGFDVGLPTTRLGKASMWMAVAFVAMFVINMAFVGTSSSQAAAEQGWRQTILPCYGLLMMGVGFASGAAGLVAILSDGERSLLTVLAVVPMLFVAVFLIGELLVPH